MSSSMKRNNENWITNFKNLALEILESRVSEKFREEYNRLIQNYK